MKAFNLVHQQARDGVSKYAQIAPQGWRVVFSEPSRKIAQNDKFHAMIGDIAKQTKYIGRTWDAGDMKRILIDEFADEMRTHGTPLGHDSRIIPSENGRRIIQLEIRSSEFRVKEASDFIEFLFFWGAQRGVVWTETMEAR